MINIGICDDEAGMLKELAEKINVFFIKEQVKVNVILGLSIVYNLVQLMGGTIGVKSEKNAGSSFTVCVPFQLVTDNEEWERKRQNLLKGFQVLAADDDPCVGEQTAVILKDIGANTVWVNSGYRAVEEVERSVREKAVFDIAMLDWKMPGIDGIETARRIRRLVGPDTMLIMITAYNWNNIEKEAREAGIDFFIAKPLLRSSIYETFDKLDNKESYNKPALNKIIREDALKGQRILLVEDNLLNQEIAQTLLEMNGAVVDAACDGKEALDCFLETEPGYYNAVLMDIRMPVMDGLEASRRIRQMNRPDAGTVPILAMTANAFEEDKRKAYDAKMTGYLVKPLDINVLVEELEKVLNL